MSDSEEHRETPIIRALPGGRQRVPAPPDARQRARALIVVALVMFLFAVLPFTAHRLADWLWYRDLGFERVFLTKIAAQWALAIVAGLVAFAIIAGNVKAALRGSAVDSLLAETRLDAEARARAAVLTRLAEVAAVPAALLIAFLAALGIAAEWRTALSFLYRTPFGVSDPVFGRDVGYYVFTLPAIGGVLDFLGTMLILGGLLALPVYVARGVIFARGGWHVAIESAAAVHLAILVAGLLVISALRIHFVRIPSLLLAQHTPLFGGSYTDLHARLPALRLLSVVALVCAAAVVWGAVRGRLVRVGGRAVAGYLIAAVLASVVPAIYQRLVVQPNELTRESPQIVNHIRATRQAWGVDAVTRRELGGESRLTLADLAANRATIDNVRLWDREPLLQTYGQIQSIRTYYDFVAVDDDRYRIGGQLRQVMLSARELNTDALPTRTFINEHLTYTHGMGVTLGPSNAVTAEGLPVLFVKDLPPASTEPSVRITRPQIYFGELTHTFVLAPTRQREFDYPAREGADEAAVYSSYGGTTGVRVNSFLRRALFAFRFGSLNIVLSRDVTDSTRILYHRNVRERAQRALPFLVFDRDPYLVVTGEGHLKWLLDAYTRSDRYPYAQPWADGTNYVRNSVKVVIDAYDGDVQAYVAEPADPIIRTFARIYPGLLRPLETMDAELRAHLRYPEDLFRMQTVIYATYHMNDPETFYHREDQWQIPGTGDVTEGSRPASFMRHIVMRLPGEREPEFILMRPFTPRQKDNLAAWMVARNDGEHYGKLVVYRFPRQSLVFGPTQIVNRINQDTEVARQISLWDQRGSQVIAHAWAVPAFKKRLLEDGKKKILLNLAGRKVTEPAVSNEINSLAAEFHPVPVVVLADSDELVQILKALECGAKGYIPSSIGIAVCVEAINLAVAGGTFVPAKSVMTMRKVIGEGGEATGSLASMFTQRQEEVIRELRRGKANKIIAYELNLRESTVKVHIRNIMKKLKATNRTEVAYMLSEMFPG
jgi:uncharacterized protein